MNSDKTSSLYFSLKSDHTADDLLSTKSSGIVIDNRLTWEAHIDYLASKLTPIVFQIRKLLIYRNFEAAVRFCTSNFDRWLNGIGPGGG